MANTISVRLTMLREDKSSIRMRLRWSLLSFVLCQSSPVLSQTSTWSQIPVTNSFSAQAKRAAWSLDSNAVFQIGGGTEGPTVLVSVFGAAVLSGNRIAIADAGSNQIRIFAPNGAFIRAFGRKGMGPGEFNSLWSLQRSADTLVGVDASGRAQVFAIDGTLLRSYARPLVPNGRSPTRAGLSSDGSVIVYGTLRPTTNAAAPAWLSVQRQASADTIELVRIPASPANAAPRAWDPVGVVAASNERVCVGYQAEYDIACFDPHGKILFRVRRAMTPRSITEDEKQFLRSTHFAANPGANRQALEKEAAAFLFAESAPAFGSLSIATTGELWVSDFHRAIGRPGPGAFIAPSKPVRWSVFGRTGDWIADIALPARFVPYEMGADYVVGVTFDKEDVEHVVLYRIRR